MLRNTARTVRTTARIAGALLTIVFIAIASSAEAHPLGNFTVNRYARLEPGTHELGLVYVVDYAEIPTFQTLAKVPALAAAPDAEALAGEDAGAQLAHDLSARWAAGLHVTLDGAPLTLAEREHTLVFADGLGGLPTMKLHLRFAAPWPVNGASLLRYEDRNEPDRLGWREIVVVPTEHLVATGPPLPFVERTHELTAYPTDPGAGFPQETQATLRLIGVGAAEARGAAGPTRVEESTPGTSITPQSRVEERDDRFARLVTAQELTPELILVSLLIAFALGGFHALSPGHGKTIVAAYLVGARGTARHALILSAIVTATHTIAVFLLGFVTLALSAQVLPERLYPWMQLMSGIVIVLIGFTMTVRRFRSSWQRHTHNGALHHEHHHAHEHGHTHGHVHPIPAGEPTMGNLFALGVSGGILPCPSALVVLLSAIALHRVAFGLVLIVAFSLGLASVLCGLGILVVRAGALLERFESTSGLMRRAPALSALLVTVLGLLLVGRAIADFKSATSPLADRSPPVSLTDRPR